MQHDNAQRDGQAALAPVDPRGQAMRDAMWKGHGGFEIALVPVLFGLLGWVLDGYIGITPTLTIILAIVGLGGAIANQYYRYMDSMDAATEERMAVRKAKNPVSESQQGPKQAFGPVTYEEVDMSIDFSSDAAS